MKTLWNRVWPFLMLPLALLLGLLAFLLVLSDGEVLSLPHSGSAP